MEEIIFEVKGSSPEPYDVVFVKRSGTNLSASCSCRAGENGQYCKHRFSILEGKAENIVSNNLEQVETIKSWLAGTDVEEAIITMQKLEEEALRVKKELAAAKKQVAKAMRD